MHLLKCFDVAVALLPSSVALSRRASALTSYRDGVVRVRPDEVDPEGRLARRRRDVRGRVIVEAAAEGVFQLWRVLCQSKTRRLFMLVPGRRKRQGATGVGAGRRGARAMMVLVPGRGSPPIRGGRAFVGAHGHWLVAVVAYPVLGDWAAFTAFVKFAFVVFALNTLAGFEDFDSPGWLLG